MSARLEPFSRERVPELERAEGAPRVRQKRGARKVGGTYTRSPESTKVAAETGWHLHPPAPYYPIGASASKQRLHLIDAGFNANWINGLPRLYASPRRRVPRPWARGIVLAHDARPHSPISRSRFGSRSRSTSTRARSSTSPA